MVSKLNFLPERHRNILEAALITYQAALRGKDEIDLEEEAIIREMLRELRPARKSFPLTWDATQIHEGTITFQVLKTFNKKPEEVLEAFLNDRGLDPSDWTITQSEKLFDGIYTRYTCRSRGAIAAQKRGAKTVAQVRQSQEQKLTASLKNKTPEEALALLTKMMKEVQK